MKSYFGYIRVSTVRQGVHGVSLIEQRAAIERHASRSGFNVVEWFEELETAAKRGRPVFTRMMTALRKGAASGVIIHKIDRSARNLRDWADLADLIDGGIEVHFAGDAVDLNSRGGRLSADIQAVVAADYIRNLREETRKGFYGRLNQGLYPLKAPVGYLNCGGGKPKELDPSKAPLVRYAFETYATGRYTLATLGVALYQRGLRTRAGQVMGRNHVSKMLNNIFYTGVIRIQTTGETFTGVHARLIEPWLFDVVQARLRGRLVDRAQVHNYLYRRLLRCVTCGRSLIGSRQRGRVYYRCQTVTCPTTSVREDAIDGQFADEFGALSFTEADVADTRRMIVELLQQLKGDEAAREHAIDLQIAET